MSEDTHRYISTFKIPNTTVVLCRLNGLPPLDFYFSHRSGYPPDCRIVNSSAMIRTWRNNPGMLAKAMTMIRE